MQSRISQATQVAFHYKGNCVASVTDDTRDVLAVIKEIVSLLSQVYNFLYTKEHHVTSYNK